MLRYVFAIARSRSSPSLVTKIIPPFLNKPSLPRNILTKSPSPYFYSTTTEEPTVEATVHEEDTTVEVPVSKPRKKKPAVETANYDCIFVDGTPLVVRAYHGTKLAMKNANGTPVQAVYTFVKMILKLKQEFSCKYFVIFFDSGKASVRQDNFPQYKANRKPTEESLRVQFPIARQAANALQCKTISVDKVEADDLIASYTKKSIAENKSVLIVSSDKDLYQLVEDNINYKVHMFDPMKREFIKTENVLEKFNVYPHQIVDYLALVGDAADNIPGIEGIGKVQAAKLLKDFESIDNLMANIDSVSNKKIAQKLRDHATELFSFVDLVKLKEDCSVVDFETIRNKPVDNSELIPFLETHNFESIIKLVSKKSEKKETKIDLELSKEEVDTYKRRLEESNYSIVESIEDLQKLIESIKLQGKVSVHVELSIKELHENNLMGISFSLQGNTGTFVPLLLYKNPEEEDISFDKSIPLLQEHEYVKLLKKEVFENNSILKVFYNAKSAIKALFPYGIDVQNFDDIMVMSYVLHCGQYDQSFESLLQNVLHKSPSTVLIDMKEVIGIGKKKVTLAHANLHSVALYTTIFSDYTIQMYQKLNEELSHSERLKRFYLNIELPLVRSLADLEIHGVVLDVKQIQQMAEEYAKKIEELKTKISEAFDNDPNLNINSNQQLGEAIFEKKKVGTELSKKSKASGQYVVDSELLQQLSKQGHTFADLILEYRALTKLYGTYLLGLQSRVNPYTHRIHTNYQNALTVTGRLSCISPNLQNIPIRTKEGKQIRKCFIAPEGYSIIKADYSQVELRILAHVAEIQVLRDAFKNGKDVHSITASQVFGVPVEQVDKEMRRKAKAINFGIIYGMSQFGLAKQINVTTQQASQYIYQYFKQYPGIKDYMENTKTFCRDKGYVNTLFGRRCHIPNINDENKTRRSFAERTSINTPIQGTSADITKIAMNRCHDEFLKRNLKTRMIIQVHDEIVFEAPNEELEIVKPLVKEIMEGVGKDVKFSIPLTVDVEVHQAWVEE